jgi:hypothetical protein
MKNKLYTPSSLLRSSTRLLIPLLILFAVVPLSHSQGNVDFAALLPTALVGTWVTHATLAIVPPGFPSATFQALDTFNIDGTMQAVAQIPGVTIGSGVWKPTGPGRFTFTFTFYRPDPSSALLLPVQVSENVRMTGKDSYVTTDVIVPLDINGNTLTCPNPPFPHGVCAFPGTVQATRYEFASFNTTLP